MLKTSLYGFLAGLIIILIAIDILVLVRALLPFPILVSINFAVIGLLLLFYAYLQTEKSEKIYYNIWGLFFLILSISIATWNITGDGMIGLAILLAGIGGLVIYASFSQK